MRRDSKASVAVSVEHDGRHSRGQAERGATAPSERLTESLPKIQLVPREIPAGIYSRANPGLEQRTPTKVGGVRVVRILF